MKKALIAAMLLAGLVCLGACSGNSPSAEGANEAQTGEEKAGSEGAQESAEADSNEAVQEQAGEAAEASSGETRMFETVKGPIEIPANPKKIVSDYYLGEFLAVGVKPVIASPYSLDNPFLQGHIDGIEALNVTSSETALEMIVAAEPDLIVTLNEADYENYAQIAPTVVIPYDGARSPEDLFYYIADMVGKKAEAEAYMAEFNDKAMGAKDEVLEAVDGRTISFIEVWPNEIYVLGSHFARGGNILFDMWGLKAPAKVQAEMVDGDKQYDVVSLEVLPEYAGDIVFYSVLAGADSAFVDDSAVWKSLPAVQNGLVKEYEQIAFMHIDPLSLSGQLDFYIDYFRSLKG